MAEEEIDKDLERLFRSKLEENEMGAGSDLTGRFMRRLGRKEFVRFNPARFNLYYLAAAAAALTVAGVLLFTSQRADTIDNAGQQETPQTDLKTEEIRADDSKTPDRETVTLKVTDTSTVTGAVKAETAPAGVTERQSLLIRSDKAEGEEITVRELQKDEISLPASELHGALIEASANSGCVPLHVRFTSTATRECNAEWTFGDGGTSKENNPDYIYDIPGTYTVSLTLTSPKSRRSIATMTIEAWTAPVAAFEIRQSGITAGDDQTMFINLSTGAVRYHWDFGDGTTSTSSDPAHTYQRSGRYNVTLVAYSENGCTDSITINDVITDKGMFIRFPNAFMPNDGGPTGGYYNQRTDEDNQVFHPVSSGVATYNLKIYGKTGMLVFESDDIEMGWDGYYKGQKCSPGVYVWKVRGTYRNGQPIVMAGDVTLLNY